MPGYPFWVERTDGARFESAIQKELYAYYAEQSIVIERGDLDAVRAAAKKRSIAVYLGTMERAADRGGHSLYCSMVYIDAGGDGHGLRTHDLGPFKVGGLNCWENWLPLPRAALYGQGEDLHVAIWPGNRLNTEDITRFIAKEGRSYVISVSGLMRIEDIGDDVPHAALLKDTADAVMADGGSCIAAPTGEWLLEPETNVESLRVAELDHRIVLQERQNMDVVGHYSRPDVTRLLVNRKRQSTASFSE